MDLELLIELVKGRENLNALLYKKYSDRVYKKSCWNEIPNFIGIPA